MSLGRMVNIASTVMSRCDTVFDDTPIFITRLKDERGCRITGGRATVGSRTASAATRSWTYCRALCRS